VAVHSRAERRQVLTPVHMSWAQGAGEWE
jgi:hypothetical protein